MNYRPRIIGVGLCSIMFLCVEPDDYFYGRVSLALVGFAWPHFAYWFARQRPGNRREQINVVTDGFLGGLAVAVLSLRLWPVTAVCAMQVINGLLYGGPRFLLMMTLPAGLLGLLTGWFIFEPRIHADSEPLVVAVSIVAIFSYIALVGTTAYRLRRRQRETRAALEHEQAQSQALLVNVFPQVVIPRLKAGEAPIADQFADVTVVFIDMVGFTPIAERLGPRRTVLLLNQLFRKFDEAAGRFGIEKIETTGDGYLAIGGAPQPLDEHPQAAANFALAVIESSRSTLVSDGDYVQVRVGIHTGPVFAGVIGDSRFHYKAFGETVNVASRIQSQARPDGILVSEATFKRIQRTHLLQEHGSVELKGHGAMRTYWLLSQADTASVRSAA